VNTRTVLFCEVGHDDNYTVASIRVVPRTPSCVFCGDGVDVIGGLIRFVSFSSPSLFSFVLWLTNHCVLFFFSLFRYVQVKPLIWIEAAIVSKGSRIEYLIKAKSMFKARSAANNVEICIPVPADADSPKFKVSMGSVTYGTWQHACKSSFFSNAPTAAPEKDVIVWSIKQFPGGREFLMRAHFGLPSIHNEDATQTRPPITVKFEIPYFTVSGIQVRYLKITERSGYQALPWVRYITQSGDYQIRI
jgi:hypothetical protein